MAIKKISDKIFRSKLFWAALSLLASVVLWMFVTSNEVIMETKTIYDVPVEFKGREELRDRYALIITEGDSQRVWVKIEGNKYDVNRLSNTNISALVDLSSITTPGSQSLGFDVEYDPEVFNSDFVTAGKSANVIKFTVEKLQSKTVPVIAKFTGTLAEGYINDANLDNLPVEPISVRIQGSQAEIDLVTAALVVIDRENLDVSLDIPSTSFELVGEDYEPLTLSTVETDIDTVTVKLPLSKKKTVPLSVSFIDGGGVSADSNIIRTVIEPATIEISGPADVLDSISKIELDPIDLATFLLEEEFERTIVLPDDTATLTGEVTAKVTVTIRDRETEKFTVPNTYFEIVNVPEGIDYEIVTNSLEITVRAPSAILSQNAVKANNIRVVVNLKDANVTAGSTERYTAQVYVDGISDAGAVTASASKKYEVVLRFVEYSEPDLADGG